MMNLSDLQISLIAIGIAIVAGVILYNWMQQRRYRRHAEAAFEHQHDDVLLATARIAKNTEIDGATAEAERIEPQLGGEVPQQFPPEPAVEPAAAAAVSSRVDSGANAAVAAPKEVALDDGVSAVDYSVSIRREAPITFAELAEVLQRKFDFGKAVRWLGQRAAGAPWEEIGIETGSGQDSFVDLRGYLQLADRSGPVSEANLAEFCEAAQGFAAYVNAACACPDMREAHVRAVALDRFCAEVDVMIGINIISKDGGAFTGTKIRGLAEASGFRLGTEGMFNYCDDNGALLFSLGNYESVPFLPGSMKTLTTHGVTFLLDVPRVANGEKVFDQMMHLAGIFSTTLAGILVDDNRAPLSDGGLAKIRQQLAGIQAMMRARDIPAGSEVALRLFA